MTTVELYRPGEFTIPQQLALQALSAGWSKSTAAKIAGVSRPTLYQWLKSTPGFEQAAQEAFDDATDAVEETAYQLAVLGSPRSVEFWLRNRRADRWNNERRNLTVEGEVAVRVEESQARMLATAVERMLTKIGLTSEQQMSARRVLRVELLAIESETNQGEQP